VPARGAARDEFGARDHRMAILDAQVLVLQDRAGKAGLLRV
jgi:hypothetical protein